MQSIALLVLLACGLVLTLSGVIPPFGELGRVRELVRTGSALGVVVSAPIALPFILNDPLLRWIYVAFAVMGAAWALVTLQTWRRRCADRSADASHSASGRPGGS